MKRILSTLVIVLLLAQLNAQTYNYMMEMRNFTQINETEFSWDIYLRKGPDSDQWALYTMQNRLDYNQAILNGGAWENAFLTIDASSTELYQESVWFNSANVTAVPPETKVQLNWFTVVDPQPGDNVTVMDDTWRKVATFRAQLRKNGNPHNFADADPMLAFEIGDNNTLVLRCDSWSGGNPNAKRVGAENYNVPRYSLQPGPGQPVNTRQLASHWFTGEGNWNETARWNTVTTENSNQVPPLATNNVGIAGQATVNDVRTVNELTVVEGAYLVLDRNAKVTTTKLYNDNTLGGSTEAVTVAGWDFQAATVGSQTPYPYLADVGIAINTNIAPFQLFVPGTLGNYFNFSSSGGTIAARANNWYDDLEEIWGGWMVSLSTSGFQSLKISSKQYSVSAGPKSFKLQYSLNGTSWTDISGGTITVATNWTTGVITNLALPSAIDNQSTVYLRWQITETNAQNNSTTAIDDITITGEPLPSGILIQSTATGTGSLIHNNAGVEATVERYINRWSANGKGEDHGWHFLSSPVAVQPIRPEFVPNENPIPAYIDFYKWDESHYQNDEYGWWINVKDGSGNWNNDFEDDFVVGRGYLMAYGTPLKNYGDKAHIFSGELNVGNISLTDLSNTGSGGHFGWHLLGNPYSSAIKYKQGSWNKSNMSGFAQIWEEAEASYKVLLENEIIPAHNGFMVYTSGNGSLTIPADARLHSDSVWYKSTENQIILLARDQSRNTSQRTIIRFSPEATAGFDLEHDSYFMAGYAPMFYSNSLDNNFALNTLPELTDELVIPLGFIKNQSNLFEIEMLESSLDHDVYLIDLKENKTHNLASGVYMFSSQSGDNANRFQLKFSTVGIPGIDPASRVLAYSDGACIYVMNNGNDKLVAELLNIHGQLINSTIFSPGFHIFRASLPAGAYFVRLTSTLEQASFKIILHQ